MWGVEFGPGILPSFSFLTPQWSWAFVFLWVSEVRWTGSWGSFTPECPSCSLKHQPGLAFTLAALGLLNSKWREIAMMEGGGPGFCQQFRWSHTFGVHSCFHWCSKLDFKGAPGFCFSPRALVYDPHGRRQGVPEESQEYLLPPSFQKSYFFLSTEGFWRETAVLCRVKLSETPVALRFLSSFSFGNPHEQSLCRGRTPPPPLGSISPSPLVVPHSLGLSVWSWLLWQGRKGPRGNELTSGSRAESGGWTGLRPYPRHFLGRLELKEWESKRREQSGDRGPSIVDSAIAWL